MSFGNLRSGKGLAFLQIHIAVFLFGFTAILGKEISVNEAALVWYRMGLTVLSFLLIPGVISLSRKLPKKEILKMIGVGFIIALHWITFFGSIKLSNVSVCLSCMATATFFTAVLEPLIRKTGWSPPDLLVGLFVIPGIWLIYRFGEFYPAGITMALVSAALASLFSIFNKDLIDKHDATAISFIELGAGFILITPLVALFQWYSPESAFLPTVLDWVYLAILAFLCTTVAFILSLKALKELTTFTINLSVNLEPIYGILLAWVIYEEHKDMGWGFFAGTAIILLSIFFHPLLKKLFDYREKRHLKPETQLVDKEPKQ